MDVVAGIEGKAVGRTGGHVGSEAVRGGGFALDKIPERNAAGRAGDGGDAFNPSNQVIISRRYTGCPITGPRPSPVAMPGACA